MRCRLHSRAILGCLLAAPRWALSSMGYALKYNPDKPRWIGRDYFVLSAGHGSMFLYAWLHLSGYDLPMSEIKRFRQLHSKTPGHPEFLETPGSRMHDRSARAGRWQRHRHRGGDENVRGAIQHQPSTAFSINTASVWPATAVCRKACRLKRAPSPGISASIISSSFTTRTPSRSMRLAKATQSEDTAMRFKAYGFDVQEINGQDMQAFLDALNNAKESDNGKPKFIIAHTLIGKGIPEVAGTYKAHGEAGAKFVDAARKGLGLAGRALLRFERDVTIISRSTRSSCSPITIAGRKRLTSGARKIRRRRSSSMTRSRERFRPICSGEDSRISQGCETRHAQSRQRSASADRPGRCRFSSAAAPIFTARPSTTSMTAAISPATSRRAATFTSASANTGCARS